MSDTLTKLRQTRASNSAAAIRILLGLLFLSTGVMKFAETGRVKGVPFRDRTV